jgi:hypothetical protein
MMAFSRGLLTILLFLMSALSTPAQKVEFSADMRVSDGTGRAQTLKLFVGNMRARFDLPKEGNNTNGIGSILIDFDHQCVGGGPPRNNTKMQQRWTRHPRWSTDAEVGRYDTGGRIRFSLVRSGAEFHREGFADLEIGRPVWVRITKREAGVPAGDPF